MKNSEQVAQAIDRLVQDNSLAANVSSTSCDRNLQSWLELKLASLRSHETHIKHIYRLRWGGLSLSAITIIIGAIMAFIGLEVTFDWAFEAPKSVGAKLTNASPGIIFATIGLILGFVVVLQKPVDYQIGYDDSKDSLDTILPFIRTTN